MSDSQTKEKIEKAADNFLNNILDIPGVTGIGKGDEDPLLGGPFDIDFTLAINTHLMKEIMRLESVVESSPGDHEAFTQLARCMIEQRSFKKAKEYYTKAIVIGSQDPDAYDGLGICLLMEGKELDEAESNFVKAIELDPYVGRIRSNLASCYLEMKKFDKAEESINAAIKLDGLTEHKELLDEIKKARNPGNDQKYTL